MIRCCTATALCSASPRRPTRRAAAGCKWRGKSGELYTGHCVIRLQDKAVTYRAADATATVVRFGIPSPADLDAYVLTGEPTAVAGGFTLDGLGGWFVDGVDGDPSAVIGIGLPLTRRLLEGAGLSISGLWAANRPPE